MGWYQDIRCPEPPTYRGYTVYNKYIYQLNRYWCNGIHVFVGWETETNCYQENFLNYGYYIKSKNIRNWTMYCRIEADKSWQLRVEDRSGCAMSHLSRCCWKYCHIWVTISSIWRREYSPSNSHDLSALSSWLSHSNT